MKARRAHRVLWADSVRYRPLRRTWTRYLPGEIGQIGLGWTSESLRCSVSGQWLVYYRLGVPVVEARCPVIEYVFTLARILRFFHARNFHRRKKNLSRVAGSATKQKKRKEKTISSLPFALLAASSVRQSTSDYIILSIFFIPFLFLDLLSILQRQMYNIYPLRKILGQ